MRTDWKKQTRVLFYLCCCSVRAGRGGNSWLVRTFLFDKSWADPGIELDSHKTGSCSVPQLVVSIQLTARCFRLRSLSSFLSSSPHGLSPPRKLPWITPVSQVDISLVRNSCERPQHCCWSSLSSQWCPSCPRLTPRCGGWRGAAASLSMTGWGWGSPPTFSVTGSRPDSWRTPPGGGEWKLNSCPNTSAGRSRKRQRQWTTLRRNRAGVGPE